MKFFFTTHDKFDDLTGRLREYFPTFVKHRKREFEDLLSALHRKELKVVRDYCHKQLGVAACYRCYQLEELTKNLRYLAQEEDWQGIEKLMPSFEQYLQELIDWSKTISK